MRKEKQQTIQSRSNQASLKLRLLPSSYPFIIRLYFNAHVCRLVLFIQGHLWTCRYTLYLGSVLSWNKTPKQTKTKLKC